jgi:hypothetical protein
VLFINPGSIGPRRFRLPVSFAKVAGEEKELAVQIVQVYDDFSTVNPALKRAIAESRAADARRQGAADLTSPHSSMKFRSARKTGLTVLFVVLAFGTRLLADDVPTFSDPDVNTFVKSYAQFVSDYVDAYKAAKTGDTSKLQALQSKSRELQAQAAQIPGKIKPDESEKFSNFIGRCSEEISDVAKP